MTMLAGVVILVLLIGFLMLQVARHRREDPDGPEQRETKRKEKR